MPDQGVFRFLDLPVEVRVMIYQLLLVIPKLTYYGHDDNICIWCEWSFDCFHTEIQSKILRVCHLVYDEASPILYGQNHFTFKNPCIMFDFLGRLHSKPLSLVRHIDTQMRLDYAIPDTERLFLEYLNLNRLPKLTSINVTYYASLNDPDTWLVDWDPWETLMLTKGQMIHRFRQILFRLDRRLEGFLLNNIQHHQLDPARALPIKFGFLLTGHEADKLLRHVVGNFSHMTVYGYRDIMGAIVGEVDDDKNDGKNDGKNDEKNDDKNDEKNDDKNNNSDEANAT